MTVSKHWNFWLLLAKLLPRKLQYACWMRVIATAGSRVGAHRTDDLNLLSHEDVARTFWTTPEELAKAEKLDEELH